MSSTVNFSSHRNNEDDMRYHIHIGMNKAASTSIQRFFTDANPVLNNLGYFYDPKSWHIGDKIAIKYLNKPRCLNSLKQGLRKQHDEGRYENIVISSEQFWTPQLYQGPEGMAKVAKAVRFIFGPAQPNIIVVLREQDSFLESSYLWHVKAVPNFKKSFTEHIDTTNLDNLDYLQALSAWEAEFGEGCIKILQFEGIKRSPAMFTSKLMDAVGLDLSPDSGITLPRTNGGISREGVDFMINYPHEIASKEAQRTLRAYVERQYPKTERYSLFTEGQRTDILEYFRESNAKLMHHYGLDPTLWD